MKNILTLLIGICLSFYSYSLCSYSGLSVFPNNKNIYQNSIFIVDGYAQSQEIILGLNKGYDIYLKSGSQKIKLLVTETLEGQFRLTQAVLKPERELTAGLEYTLCIDNLPEYETLNRYNYTSEKYELIKYLVIAGNDTEKPEITAIPKEVNKSLIYYGCGPSVHVVFSNTAKDSTEIIIKTTVKNLKTGKETIYYIEPEGESIEVGHGMCSGAFEFEDGIQYEVDFTFMDASGNQTPMGGESIKFTKPKNE